MDINGTETISRRRYLDLLYAEAQLDFLERLGVDNWEGYAQIPDWSDYASIAEWQEACNEALYSVW